MKKQMKRINAHPNQTNWRSNNYVWGIEITVQPYAPPTKELKRKKKWEENE
jgi:hypothetical protein